MSLKPLQIASKPFEIPMYRDGVLVLENKIPLELGAIHHKLFLQNNPPEVLVFSIPHGLNLIIIIKVRQSRYFICRAGGGIVPAHPEIMNLFYVIGEIRLILSKFPNYDRNADLFNAAV